MKYDYKEAINITIFTYSKYRKNTAPVSPHRHGLVRNTRGSARVFPINVLVLVQYHITSILNKLPVLNIR